MRSTSLQVKSSSLYYRHRNVGYWRYNAARKDVREVCMWRMRRCGWRNKAGVDFKETGWCIRYVKVNVNVNNLYSASKCMSNERSLILKEEDEDGGVSEWWKRQIMKNECCDGAKLNGDQQILIHRMSSIVRTLYVRDRSFKLVFNTFIDFWPVQRFENRSGVRELAALTTAKVRKFWICWSRFI